MCPTMMLARASLLLCLVVGSLQLSITEFEVPVALESGENAEMRCQFDRAGESEETFIVKWFWTPYKTDNKKQLYQRIGSKPGTLMRHHIEIRNNDTIVLLKTKPSDSGVYECMVSLMSEKEEVSRHQKLTIFTPGSGPNLTMSEVADGPDEDKENDVLIECEATDVAPAPDILLTINNEEFNMTEYKTGPDANGFYDIVGNATFSKDAVDGMEVRCELFFVNENVTHPPYFFAEVYNPSGALTTTQTPENATEPEASPDSLQNPSGDSSQSHLSWALLFALGLLTQVPVLL